MRRGFVSILVVVLLVASAAAALAASDGSANAHHMQWVERSDVVHIFVFDDGGPRGDRAASVHGRSPIRFGFEQADDSVEALQALLDDPDHDVQVSMDGGGFFSVKSGYQAPFVAVPGEGPRWSWDHDGDGLGDGNGNGIGDWDFPVMFWRYSVSHLTKGIHTFEFQILDGTNVLATDLVTVDVG